MHSYTSDPAPYLYRAVHDNMIVIVRTYVRMLYTHHTAHTRNLYYHGYTVHARLI